MIKKFIIWILLLYLCAYPFISQASSCDTDETLVERLVRHEGKAPCVYGDIYGNPTIGVGHLLMKPVDPDLCWTAEKIMSALDHDIDRAGDNARFDYGSGFYTLPHDVQDILTEMAFQLGGSGLAGFRQTLAAIRAGDYELAADNMLRSRWAMQTPNRAEELACLMRRQ